MLIDIRDITKVYEMGEEKVQALAGVTLGVERGEYVAIMGPSGSGKSTLMNLIGCLDTPSSGSYVLNGKEVARMTDDELAAIRNQEIGFVFQTFNLLPRTSALQQVELPLVYGGALAQGPARARDPGAQGRRPRRPDEPHAQRDVRRPAPARRRRARADQRPEHPAGRRADRQPRLADRRGDHGALRRAQRAGATRSSSSRTRKTSPRTRAASCACSDGKIRDDRAERSRRVAAARGSRGLRLPGLERARRPGDRLPALLTVESPRAWPPESSCSARSRRRSRRSSRAADPSATIMQTASTVIEQFSGVLGVRGGRLYVHRDGGYELDADLRQRAGRSPRASSSRRTTRRSSASWTRASS